MPQETPRIAELRRRVQADPASIAFAQLAEEYRRAGHYQEAVRYCRAGLARHPSYLSARVTLGRALIELGELDDAARELEVVLRSAPDNLAALRGMAEIHQRRGAMAEALEFYKRALALARFDPELEDAVNHLRRELGEATAGAGAGMSFEEAQSEPLSAARRVSPAAPGQPHGSEPPKPPPSGADLIDFDAILASLGAPDAAPPPITQHLIDGAVVRPPVVLPADSAPGAQDDPFAALEAQLRGQPAGNAAVQIVEPEPGQTPPQAASSSEPALSPADAFIVEELEAWLRALAEERAPRQA